MALDPPPIESASYFGFWNSVHRFRQPPRFAGWLPQGMQMIQQLKPSCYWVPSDARQVHQLQLADSKGLRIENQTGGLEPVVREPCTNRGRDQIGEHSRVAVTRRVPSDITWLITRRAS